MTIPYRIIRNPTMDEVAQVTGRRSNPAITLASLVVVRACLECKNAKGDLLYLVARALARPDRMTDHDAQSLQPALVSLVVQAMSLAARHNLNPVRFIDPNLAHDKKEA